MAEPSDDLISPPSNSLSPLTGEGVVIDIGTGDGFSVYQCALRNPNKRVCKILRICAPEAVLEIGIALDPERDRTEIERLELSDLSTDQIDRELTPRYQAAGFEILERGALAPSEWPS